MLKSRLTKCVSLFALCAALTACGTVDPVPYRGIASSTQLRPDQKDDTGHIPYSYSTQVDWQRYSSVILDPVVVYRGVDNQFGDMSDEDKAELARYMRSAFAKSLIGHKFSLTNAPYPGALHIKLTLAGAATNTPIISPFTHFDIAGNLYNGVQAIRGGEGMVSGSVMYAVEVYDASTSQLLKAYVSKQYPGSMNIMASFGSLAAAKTGLEKGADALVEQLR